GRSRFTLKRWKYSWLSNPTPDHWPALAPERPAAGRAFTVESVEFLCSRPPPPWRNGSRNTYLSYGRNPQNRWTSPTYVARSFAARSASQPAISPTPTT